MSTYLQMMVLTIYDPTARKRQRVRRHAAHPLDIYSDLDNLSSALELWTSCNKSLTSLVSSVLSEVLDETCCEVLSLSFPL